MCVGVPAPAFEQMCRRKYLIQAGSFHAASLHTTSPRCNIRFDVRWMIVANISELAGRINKSIGGTVRTSAHSFFATAASERQRECRFAMSASWFERKKERKGGKKSKSQMKVGGQQRRRCTGSRWKALSTSFQFRPTRQSLSRLRTDA